MLQANWLLHKYRKDKRLAEEQDLTDWAEKHYAAAMAGRRSMTVNLNNTRSTVPAESESEPDSESISGLSASQTSGELSPQSSRRRSKGAASDVAEKSSKPVVQPWTRMVGREAPVNTTNTNAITSNSKWRGAVAGAVAVNKLAAGHVFDLEFAAEGSSSSVHAAASASAAVPLLPGQHVAALEDTNMGTSPLFRSVLLCEATHVFLLTDLVRPHPFSHHCIRKAAPRHSLLDDMHSIACSLQATRQMMQMKVP